MKIGDRVSEELNIDQNNEAIKLSDSSGKYTVLYFYPKDNTPGCTLEAKDFRDNINKFVELNTRVIGVSKDSCEKHQKFINKYDLPFQLIADVDGRLCEEFGVIVQKSMFGKKYMGINRSTFIIDPKGHLIAQWSEVKVKGHVKDVLVTLTKLQQ